MPPRLKTTRSSRSYSTSTTSICWLEAPARAACCFVGLARCRTTVSRSIRNSRSLRCSPRFSPGARSSSAGTSGSPTRPMRLKAPASRPLCHDVGPGGARRHDQRRRSPGAAGWPACGRARAGEPRERRGEGPDQRSGGFCAIAVPRRCSGRGIGDGAAGARAARYRPSRADPGGRTCDGCARCRRATATCLGTQPRREGEGSRSPDPQRPQLDRRARLCRARRRPRRRGRPRRGGAGARDRRALLPRRDHDPGSHLAAGSSRRRPCPARPPRRSGGDPRRRARGSRRARRQRSGAATRRRGGARARKGDDPGAERRAVERPTEAELSVLRLMAADFSMRAIGDQLFLSHNTIRSHRHNLYRKLGVHSRPDALARAAALGLLTQPDSPG